MTIAGVILAGGRSTRMNGLDKATLRLGSESLLDRAVQRLAPQVDELAINSNSLDEHSAAPVLRDATTTFDGPLAGVLAGLVWAQARGHRHIASVAVDTPFFPADLVGRLSHNTTDKIVVARSNGRIHPTFALWPVTAATPLSAFMERGETRKVMAFLDEFGFEAVDFAIGAVDQFFNVNTKDDLVEAERLRSEIEE